MRSSLFALPIFGICLVIQLSNSQIICDKDHYTIVYSNGTFKRCLLCGKCHEGYGLYPPCGSKLFHRPMTAECRSCKAGTFSSEYDSSSCKDCNQCAEHEIKKAECTNKSDTACSGKCEAGYFMSETVYNCQECSACCSDGKDEKIKDCVSLGIKNKECSPRPDKTCASTGQPPTTAATKGSEGLAKKYLIIIIVSPIVVAIAVVIMIVMVCLRQKRKKAEERNGSSIASQDYANDVGPQAHQLQVTVPITEYNSASNPTYQGTPTQQPKNNPKSTTASQDYATDLGPQTHQLQQSQVVPAIAHSASNPTYQGTPTQQPKNNPKPTTVGAIGGTPLQDVAAKERQKPKDSNSNVKKPSVSRQGSQDSQTSGEPRKHSFSLRSTTEVFQKSLYKRDDSLIESEEVPGVETHEPIKIIKHPKSQTVKEGSKVQLECKLEKKSQHFLYQWYRDDGSAMLGQNDTVLVLDPVELQHFGSYLCRVSFKDSFTEYKESNFAVLDVNPTPGRNGMRPRCLSEVDFSTMDCVASLLGSQRDWRGIGSKYGMAGYKIDALANATPDERGRGVLEFLKTSKPKLTVYDFCKTLKEETFKRFDIVKELENHFLVST